MERECDLNDAYYNDLPGDNNLPGGINDHHEHFHDDSEPAKCRCWLTDGKVIMVADGCPEHKTGAE